MTVSEPTLNYKSDGTDGVMSVEIDIDTAETTEPAEGAAPDRTEPAAPAGSLEIPPAPPASDRPVWLDPRFQTPEALAQAYKELESKLGAPPAPAAPATPAKAGEPAPAAPAGQVLSDAELQAYGREAVANGRLSDASYAALQAKGIPRNLVDAHVAGLVAMGERVRSEAVSVFGGDAGYREAAAWAATGLTAAEQRQYNADVNSGDRDRVQYAVAGLKARYDAANSKPAPARRLAGRPVTAAGVSGGGFASMDEQVHAQQDPRYGRDPAYTADVIRRVQESTGY